MCCRIFLCQAHIVWNRLPFGVEDDIVSGQCPLIDGYNLTTEFLNYLSRKCDVLRRLQVVIGSSTNFSAVSLSSNFRLSGFPVPSAAANFPTS
jgi:hypothetical protein